ncbi:MAG: tripartite tricarboxylate transporter TctB family protein [Burkholderiaceae bacterium]
MWPATRGGRVELALSLGVLALGVFASVAAFRLPEAGGYARIGPNFMPKIVSAGLIVLGMWLLAEVATGGWRDRVPDDPAERGEHAFHAGAFLWVSAGLFAQMALIGTAGFVLAAMVLFGCVARGFGSTRLPRDLALGLALGLAVFLFFVKFLNVSLPVGWLAPLLGTAGL